MNAKTRHQMITKLGDAAHTVYDWWVTLASMAVAVCLTVAFLVTVLQMATLH